MELETIQVQPSIKQHVEWFIRENEFLLEERPNRLQHDDFHPSNIIINGRFFAGIIDFQRMDFGDPIHDLQKLGFFSVRVSIPFTKGVIDGYHGGNQPDESFWQLYSLYSAMHIVSALVWGERMGEQQFKTMHSYSLAVIKDHNNFEKIVPSWYS